MTQIYKIIINLLTGDSFEDSPYSISFYRDISYRSYILFSTNKIKNKKCEIKYDFYLSYKVSK